MKEERPVVIEWAYHGEPDPLFGTGATQVEKGLVWVTALFTVLLYGYLYARGDLNWALWQYLVAGVIALDVGGGVVANSLNSCKRFYHSPVRMDEPGWVRWLKRPMTFVLLHVHPFVVARLYGDGSWGAGLFWYGLLVISGLIVVRVPLYLRRPVAMALTLGALVIHGYVVPLASGFAWLIPALFLKIVYGHLVREEPYRPPGESGKGEV
jgi:hypothetical protein